MPILMEEDSLEAILPRSFKGFNVPDGIPHLRVGNRGNKSMVLLKGKTGSSNVDPVIQ